MSQAGVPPLNRKTSIPWERLKPVKQDSLDIYGFVSRGDNRLLSIKAQESYYHKITARYMLFCSQHSKNLHQAFQSLSLQDRDQAINTPRDGANRTSSRSSDATHLFDTVEVTSTSSSQPAEELSHILNALRKLREAILATTEVASTPVFAQRVHIFSIRLAILALHPESYHASLRYLLFSLQTEAHPLATSELREMTTYLILDTALRLDDFSEAYRFRKLARRQGVNNKQVDQILAAVLAMNWPAFWKLYNKVDGHVRALMHWKLGPLRLKVLKAIGRSYLKCDVNYILKSATNSAMTWTELVEKENIAWTRQDNTITIRKPKQIKS